MNDIVGNFLALEFWNPEVFMTLAENLRTKYALTSLKMGGSCLPLTEVEAAAQIADRNHAPEVANEIRALKWQSQTPASASEIHTNARDVA